MVNDKFFCNIRYEDPSSQHSSKLCDNLSQFRNSYKANRPTTTKNPSESTV